MNKYEIIGIVGEGAYGVVYKAKCKETGEFGKCKIKIGDALAKEQERNLICDPMGSTYVNQFSFLRY